jgi:hypothetical protein
VEIAARHSRSHQWYRFQALKRAKLPYITRKTILAVNVSQATYFKAVHSFSRSYLSTRLTKRPISHSAL